MHTPGERSGWPVGEGEMAGRIRAFDWASTPLGPVETWPQPLVTAVDMILAAPQAMWIAWGSDLIQLYNDRYIELLEIERHPAILGQPTAVTWADFWPMSGPDLTGILTGGPSVSYTDRWIPQRFGGELRDRYFTYSYSAIPDPAVPSGVGGVLCVSFETTPSVLMKASEERQAFLLKLADELRPLSDPIAIQEMAARILGDHLGVSHVAYGEVSGDDMVVARDYNAGSFRSAAGRYRMADFGERLLTAVQEGHTVVVPDVATSEYLVPAEREAYAAMGIAALTAVPLVKQGRFVANLNVHHSEPKAWTAIDIALVQETAERTWDAVERTRAEAALRGSEARFRSVWDETTEALAISGPDGTVLAANPAYFTLYGYDEAEVVGQSFAIIFPEEQRAWAEEQYRDAFAMPERPPAYQSQVRRKDGSVRVVEARASFVEDSEGRRTAMVSAIRDVTSRVEAEEALRVSEVRLSALVMATARYTYRMSPDWSEVLQLYRLGVLADIDTPNQEWIMSYLDPEDRPQVLEAIEAATRARDVFELEHRVRREDGTVGWMLSRAVPILDDRGEILEWFGTASDVTDRKRVEEALRESEEKYRTLFTAMDQGFCVIEKVPTDPGQPSDYRIVSANPAFERHTGMSDVVGKTVLELIPGANPHIIDTCDAVVRTGRSQQFEAYVAGMDLWVEVIPAQQHDQCAVLFSNISDRKRAEASLRESEARQAFLLSLSDALRPLSDTSELKATATRLLGQYLDASRAYYGDIDEDTITIERDYSADLPSIAGRLPLAVWTERIVGPYRRGKTLVIDDVHTHPLFAGEDVSAYDAVDIRGGIGVPLVKDGMWRAVLGVACATPRKWTESEVRLVEDVAERTWAAVERARAEEALRASEQRLKRMVNIRGVGVLLFARDGTLISANDYFLSMTGYSREAVMAGKLDWRAMTPPEHIAVTEAQMGRLEQEGQIGPYEKEYFRANGSRSWMLLAGASLGDGTTVEYCIDIGDRKLAEAALRESETRLQRVFSNNMVPMAIRTRNGNIIGANDALLDLLGYTRAELDTGALRWDAITPPESCERDLAAVAEIERKGHCTPYEKAFRHKDGHLVPVIVGAGVFDERAETGILFAVDLTQRHRAEAAMSESEERFRAIAQLVPDFLCECEPDGSTVWYNDRWYEYTGQSETKATGWGWLDAIHPDDRTGLTDYAAHTVERGKGVRHEHRIRAADGSYRWFQVRIEPMRDGAGNVVRWFGAATDVHEARVARDELESRVAAATAELRSLSQRLLVVQEEERRHLSRELHDEIGQGLTGLSLNLRPGSGNPDERLAGARQIVHDLTNQVRKLSMDLRPSALDSHGLLPALLWHIERYQNRTGVQVDLRHEGLDRRFSPAVEITAYRIVQEALTNVARHAGIRQVTAQLLATDGTLVVSVRDRGLGFEPGARAESSGLSGMRERTRLVGGTISIDTAPGEGTIVTAELPVDQHATAGASGDDT